jgi:hypothetical protein
LNTLNLKQYTYTVGYLKSTYVPGPSNPHIHPPVVFHHVSTSTGKSGNLHHHHSHFFHNPNYSQSKPGNKNEISSFKTDDLTFVGQDINRNSQSANIHDAWKMLTHH